MSREQEPDFRFPASELEPSLRVLRASCVSLLMNRALLARQPFFTALIDAMNARYGSYNPLDYQQFWQVSDHVDIEGNETPISVVSLGKGTPDKSTHIAIDFPRKGTYGEVFNLPLLGDSLIFATQPSVRPVGLRSYTIRSIPRTPGSVDVAYYRDLIRQIT